MVGVYSADLVEKLAEALSELGVRRALVVHGRDGLDEITITGPSKIAEVRNGQVHVYEVAPEDFGLQRAPLEEIAGGDAQQNAAIIRAILDGERSSRRDVVLLNAAAALVAAGHADHISDAVPLPPTRSTAATRASGCSCWWSLQNSGQWLVDSG